MNMNNLFATLAFVGALAYDEKGHSYLNDDPFEWLMEEIDNDTESEEETCRD